MPEKAFSVCIKDIVFIDPPYNTGKDAFVYFDQFEMDEDEYNEGISRYDEDGNLNFSQNSETNARFYSAWCSMIYPCLFLSRNLLTNDGVIFISIDNHEVDNMLKICDEIFGASNRIACIVNINNPKGRSDEKNIATAHEYIVVYQKNEAILSGFEPEENVTKRYSKVDKKGNRYRNIDLRKTGDSDRRKDRPKMFYYFYFNQETGEFYPSYDENTPDEWIKIIPMKDDGSFGRWRVGIETAKSRKEFLEPIYMSVKKRWTVMERDYLSDELRVKATTAWTYKDLNSERGTEQFVDLGFDKNIFLRPMPLGTILRPLLLSTQKDDVVLDFFSGSATTAHAVMQLNAEDGGHRKFIMVQLPESCDEKSEAYKAGYKNICEIGKERIRRAGEKIKSEIDVVHKDDYAALVQSQQSNDQKVMTGFDSLKSSGVLTEKGYTYKDKDTKDISRITYSAEDPNDFYRFHPNALDIGFRVLKLDDSDMKDVYYAPDDYDQGMLTGLESNIKDDCTDLDLLFGCLIDWGLPLSLPYKSEKIDGCTVHTYNDGDLIACFDANIPESVVKEIAKRRPLRAVFRDSGFASSPEKINVFEIFKLYMTEDAGDITKRMRVI